MTAVRLDGCTSEPLLSYLKAIGLLAAVAEQHDTEAAGWWHQGRFHMSSPAGLDADDLVEFVATRYSPPPIISPWNSRGGFRCDRQQTSEKRLTAIEESDDRRLEPYRRAIAAGRAAWTEAEALGMLSGATVDKKKKAEFVRLCRGRLPDDALPWLDSAVVLLDDDVRYPDLLGGTGGNLSSGDLSSNAHEAVLWLITERSPEVFARHALLGEGRPKLSPLLVGQFGSGAQIANPIEYLLALHGAGLFASGVARRLDGTKAASVPFTVRVSPGTTRTTATGENVRSELWMPEWARPMTLPEVRCLLAEGRAQWSGSQSTASLDFARAAASLGVDRDITHFSRFLIAERHGKNNLAVPVGRFSVGLRRGVELTSALDPFLRSVNRIANPTQAVRSATNFVRRRIFELAERDDQDNARRLLASLHELERTIGRSRSAREAATRPLQGLRAADWLPLLDDGTAEFRLARSIASQRDQWSPDRGRQARETSTMPVLCRPVERDAVRRNGEGALDVLTWSGLPPAIDLLGPDVRRSMREGWKIRGMRCAQHPSEARDAAVTATPGTDLSFDDAIPSPLDDVLAYGEHGLNQRRLVEWLAGLVMLDWTTAPPPDHPGASEGVRSGIALGPAFGATVPFFSRHDVIVAEHDGAASRVAFHPSSLQVSAVTRGDGTTATELAIRRLRQFGLDAPLHLRPTSTHPGALDAALVPMSRRDTHAALRSINPGYPPPTTSATQESA